MSWANMGWASSGARDWHLGVPSPALRCAGKKAVRARTQQRALPAHDI